MSIVENLLSQIAESKLNGVTKPLNFELDDDTFAKLLEKQLGVNSQENSASFENIGIPSGFEIEPFDAEPMEKVSNVSSIDISDFKMKDLYIGKQEMTNLYRNAEENSPFANFIVKHATDAYNVFGKELITDINDFADDLAKMI